MWLRRFWLLLLTALLYSYALTADVKIPPAPSRWATDTAGFLSPQAIATLDSQLEAFERETGHQFLVYIGTTTGGYPLEEWAVKAFEAWKVGRKGLDDGLVLFIIADDHKIRIEVGYGLEPVVTDAKAAQVIHDILEPGIRTGAKDRAVMEAVASLQATISGKSFTSPPVQPEPVQRPVGSSKGGSIIVVILVIIFVILFITNPSFALWLLFNILTSGGGRGSGGSGWSGGGGGGGGFSGGGGRSGGGGASGGW